MSFVAKLNKRDTPYVITDEVLVLSGGAYQGYLGHDNVSEKTLEIYPQPGRQGEKVANYTLEVKGGLEWKLYLRAYADPATSKLYANYESYGDTVEAEDVNELQQAAENFNAVLTREEHTTLVHRSDRNNPHSVTKSQVGLGSVDDTSDASKPVSAAQKEADEATAAKAAADLKAHTDQTNNPHGVTKTQVGLGSVDDVQQAAKADFDTHAGDAVRHLTAAERAAWSDKYTKSEVDNKISTLETAIDWKESVATFADIATTYPDPVDGWTVNVQDTDYTYRYGGAGWIAISANAIPKATASVDGLMATADKSKLDGIEAGAIHYVHPSSHPASMITGLAAVAKSGNYDDLANRPTVPGSLPPSGAAGGDLVGTYPNPTIKLSVALTGAPTAPTPVKTDNSTKIATTAFVAAAVAAGSATGGGVTWNQLKGV